VDALRGLREVAMRFANRADAGRRLAAALQPLADRDVVVVGLPRGGVPVAVEVARALRAPLDVIVVRKLGVPFQSELGMGAIGEGGARIINDEVVQLAGVSEQDLAEVEQRERSELERRVRRFRGDRSPVPLAGRTVVVVDDGIATGSTARAACQVARAQGAARVVLAAPVGPDGVEQRMRPDADGVVCLHTPRAFLAIGQFYDDFDQTSDEQVIDLLRQASHEPATPAGRVGASVDLDPPRDEEVSVDAGRVRLAGHLTVPAGASGIVAFAHGSGSSRHSARNRYVASELNAAGLGTLLFDLLSLDEETDRGNVFDIDLLARRLLDATAWLRAQPDLHDVRIGYFGASTGAGAALWAAAAPNTDIAAVVSRGGRPDLAGPKLGLVQAPTLLIVGGYDDVVVRLNRIAQAQLRCENRLEIVPGATHLFAEPGTLEQVGRLAGTWFSTHLTPAVRPRAGPPPAGTGWRWRGRR
jgi:putative phosphoribosyl transferase